MGNHWKSFTQLNSSPGRDEAEFSLFFFLLEAVSCGCVLFFFPFFPVPCLSDAFLRFQDLTVHPDDLI